jgi:hypothetical protein
VSVILDALVDSKNFPEESLSMTQQHSSGRSLRFAEDFVDASAQRRYRLLELDEAERVGSTALTVKRSAAGASVLCSGTATFVLKTVETSNTLLLLRGDGDAAVAQLGSYYECVKCRASMATLAQLLADAGAAGVELSALRRRVPASDAEISAALVQLKAIGVERGGSTRYVLLPSFDVARLLRMALAELQLHDDMSLERVDVERLVDGVARLEPQRDTVRALLQLYVVGGVFQFDAAALVFARSLLERRPRWLLREFMAEWRALLPPISGAEPPQLDQLLRGIALIDDADDDADDDGEDHSTVALFDRDSLSLDAPTRLTQMFAKRARWPVAHVEPYLGELLAPAQLAKLLQRATRTVTVNERKYFVPK